MDDLDSTTGIQVMAHVEEDQSGDQDSTIEELLHSDHEENATAPCPREAMLSRVETTGKAAPAFTPEMSLLTSAIVNLTNLLNKHPSVSGETSSPNTLKRKGNESDFSCPPAKKHASQAASSMSTNPHDEGEHEGLLNQLLSSVGRCRPR